MKTKIDVSKVNHLLNERDEWKSPYETPLGKKIIDADNKIWQDNKWEHGGMVKMDVLKKGLAPFASKFTKKDFDHLEDENHHSANEALLALVGKKYNELKEEVEEMADGEEVQKEMWQPARGVGGAVISRSIPKGSNIAKKEISPEVMKQVEKVIPGTDKTKVQEFIDLVTSWVKNESTDILKDTSKIKPEQMSAIKKILPKLDEKKIRELMDTVFGMMREEEEKKEIENVKNLEKFLDTDK